MRVVVLPGVGFHKNKPPKCRLFDILEKEDFDTTWFNWKHIYDYPEVDLEYKSLRKWLAEVIFDFQYVIKHANEFVLPPADCYIAHSAGSVLALIQKKPSIIFGSPAILVETISNQNPVELINKAGTIVNIVNPFDILAYPIPLPIVQNEYVKFQWWNPLKAHTGYWEDKDVCKRIVDSLKKIRESGI